MKGLRRSLLTLALLLAGCTRDEAPAPVVSGTPAPQPVPVAPVLVESGGGQVTVAKGETLYAVARAAGVPVRALIDANNLQPPFKLKAGQVLTVPRISQHIVQPGETLYAVARRYNVEASTLAQLNHLPPPYTIKSGLPLQLPPPVEAIAAAPEPPAPSTVAIVATPIPPPAATTPPVTKPTVKPVAPTVPPPSPTPAPAITPAPSAPVPAPTQEAAVTPPALAVPPAASVAAIVANHKPPVDPLFLWPVRGRILAAFGPAAGGTNNDGINIAAPEGTAVSAAENGTVAYAGNELRGYGNLLLIKHDDGWVTAYAHNDVLLVKKGDKVRRGQAIARVGTTGGVSDPQLHFELRRGTKAIDPLDHLPPLAG
jgi:murein DD-endopeptidase MepM/ murein hydrolase activator NlpD